MTDWTDFTDRIEVKRNQIAAILIPHLGNDDGYERANNIMQAIIFDEDPIDTTKSMLRHFQLNNLEQIVQAIRDIAVATE